MSEDDGIPENVDEGAMAILFALASDGGTYLGMYLASRSIFDETNGDLAIRACALASTAYVMARVMTGRAWTMRDTLALAASLVACGEVH